MRSGNPFIINGYGGEALFCGRQQELQTCFDLFRNGENWMLTSWPGMGKTSLIFHFLDHLKKKNQYFKYLYTDLFLIHSIEDMIQFVVSALLKKAGDDHTQWPPQLVELIREMGASINFDLFSGHPSVELHQERRESSKKILRALFSYLSKDRTPWIIVLDEWQQVYEFRIEVMIDLWQDIFRDFPRLRFIFLSDHTNSKKNAQFLEKSGGMKHLQLEGLKAPTYLPFIKRLFSNSGKKISGEALEDIFMAGRGETYPIQLICHKLFHQYDHIGTQEVQECMERILEEKEREFKNVYRLITHTQWKMLAAIADVGRVQKPLASSFIGKYELTSPSTVQTALKSLLSKSLIRKDQAYELQDTFLQRWLKKMA